MYTWDLLDLYFKNHKYPFTSHHLDSFREFVKTYIPDIIKSYNPITMIKYDDYGETTMKVDVYIGGKNGTEIFVDRPITFEGGSAKLITPNDARLKNLTYESHIYTTVLIEITDINNNIIQKEFKRVAIGSIPIMLHSDICILNNQGSEVLRKLGECVYDSGGYFIIDGKEKVIIAQERITTNRLFISELKNDNNYSHKAVIRCTGESGENMLQAKTLQFFVVKQHIEKNTNDESSDEDENEQQIDSVDTRIPSTILVSIPSIQGKIPLSILFRALGIESDKDIFESIFGTQFTDVERLYFENFIRPILANTYDIYTQEKAIMYIRSLVKYKTIEQVKYILTTDVMPNVPIFKNKSKFLGYLVKQIFDCVKEIAPPTDRDSYVYKRVDISGYLLAELFHESYSKLTKFIRDKMDSMYHYGAWNQKRDYENFINSNNIYKLISNLLIAQTFAKSLKGTWGIVNDEDPELGKVQDLSRISYIGFLSHLRRVNMPLDRSIKITSPHKLHCNQYGIMCPFETPDGASVGYLKNLAFLTKIAAGTSTENIKKCLLDIGIIPIEDFDSPFEKDICKVFLNGTLYGITFDPYKITRTLKAYRRNSLINILISISWHIKSNEIRVLTEAGRPSRPLIIANRHLKKTNNWFDLISGTTLSLSDEEKSDEFYYRNVYINPKTILKGLDDEEILETLEKNAAVIEYLDVEEADTCYIAMNEADVNKFHTHLEIHPSTMLSVVSANIPMSNHNQSARNVFHAAQSKQAIGMYATNFNDRFDTMSYVHHYPQKPIISTQLSQYTCSDYMPNGFNVIVAIMTYTGFNQEDSIMINKNSVERGLFNLSYYKSITATAKEVSPNEKIIFGNPIEYKNKGYDVKGIKYANYGLLDEMGFIKEQTFVPKGQKVVIVGMLNVKEVLKEVKRGVFTEYEKVFIYTDVSIVTDNSIYGIVNKVYYSNKSVGNNSSICKVRFLKIRKPEFGDKHASRHGQKGVIGMIIPEESMPFTKNGIRPDIIINPHAIPSRMTIGHLVECVFAKLCCFNGSVGDGSVFINFNENKIYDELEKYGFNKYGNELLYNGYTGQQIKTDIFIGPTFYFRLKHMVDDKLNVRGHDRDKNELPKVMLTRQPTSGRRKGGGLRIGEMERDSILSHGTSLFVQESMMERSDKYQWAICKRCGVACIYNPSKKRRIIKCNMCNKDDIVLIRTPYSFKLFSQELESMGVSMKINTDDISFGYEQGMDKCISDQLFDEYGNIIKIDELDINEIVGGEYDSREEYNQENIIEDYQNDGYEQEDDDGEYDGGDGEYDGGDGEYYGGEGEYSGGEGGDGEYDGGDGEYDGGDGEYCRGNGEYDGGDGEYDGGDGSDGSDDYDGNDGGDGEDYYRDEGSVNEGENSSDVKVINIV